MSIFRWCLLFVGLFLAFPPCTGQVVERDSLFRRISSRMSAEFSCHFTYAQGSGKISSGLGNNAAELKRLDAFVSRALAHPDLSISRIRLTGYCSIEGSYARNEVLAIERVEGFYAYLREHYPQLYRCPHDQAWVIEDWDDLSRLIRESRLNEREEVLDIARKVRTCDEREALLQKLNGGRPWLFMERELFPQLRRVEVRVEYKIASPVREPVAEARAPATIEASPQPSPEKRETIPAISSSLWSSFPSSCLGEGRDKASSSFALKTNLLLLADVQSDLTYTTPVPNAALEYYIDDYWSVELGAMLSNWRRLTSRREFQGISGYRLEPPTLSILPPATAKWLVHSTL
jgi:hypothetical protein